MKSMKNIFLILAFSIFGTSSFSFGAESKQILCGRSESGENIFCNEEQLVQAFEILKKSQNSDPAILSEILVNGTKVGVVFTLTSLAANLFDGPSYFYSHAIEAGRLYKYLGVYVGEITLTTVGLGLAAVLYSGDTEASSSLDVLYSKPEGLNELLKLSVSELRYWISVNPAIAENIMALSSVLVQHTMEANQ
jgi:hypothetical protein